MAELIFNILGIAASVIGVCFVALSLLVGVCALFGGLATHSYGDTQ
jgi:Ca2+/H+ antiporter